MTVLFAILTTLFSASVAVAQNVPVQSVRAADMPALQPQEPDVLPAFAPSDDVRPERVVRIVGALTRESVEAALQPHRGALRACGAEAELRLVVAEDGSVTSAEVLPADVAVAQCLLAATEDLAFPSLDDGGMAVVRVPVGRGATRR
jgi:hypothetical protein